MLSANNRSRLALFLPHRPFLSETFIRAHVERLPFVVVPFYGHELGIESDVGKAVWPGGLFFTQAASRLSPRVYEWTRTRLLANLLRRRGFDAVLAEYGTTGAYLAPACERAGVPLFVHFHGFDASRTEVLDRNRGSYEEMFRTTAGVFCVSERMGEQLRRLGAPADRLHLTHCGVDPELFGEAEPAKAEPNFVAVGRFVEKKAPHLTILAFSRVVKVVPKATLTMIGTGPLFGPCRRLVQALRLEDSIYLLGAQQSDVVAEHMRLARCFVQHSLVADDGDSEGTPVAVIEAQMSGLPVVATDHAGIPDVVVNGVTGVIVNEADIDGMTTAMLCIAQDSQLAGRMGAEARARALTSFSMDRHIGEITRIIAEGLKYPV